MSLFAPEATDAHLLVSGRQLFSCGHSDSIGQRDAMEDAAAIVGEFAGAGTQYFGVFDGHGGNRVACYCANNLHRVIAQMMKTESNMDVVLKQAFAEVDAKVAPQNEFVGCTVAVVFLVQNIVYAANVGDSRIVLIENGKAVRISVDHKATNPDERKLVFQRGGHIIQNRVDGMLAVTRAIGDGGMGESVSCEPYVKRFKRNDGARLIIACDGVWDVVDDQAAADLVVKYQNPAEAARILKEEALRRGSTDNVTCIVVNLTPK